MNNRMSAMGLTAMVGLLGLAITSCQGGLQIPLTHTETFDFEVTPEVIAAIEAHLQDQGVLADGESLPEEWPADYPTVVYEENIIAAAAVDLTQYEEVMKAREYIESVEISYIKYKAIDNTLTHVIPEANIYMQPFDTTVCTETLVEGEVVCQLTELPDGLTDIATIPGLDNGANSMQSVNFVDGGQTAAAQFMAENKFNIVGETLFTFDTGYTPLKPAGGATIEVTVSLTITTSSTIPSDVADEIRSIIDRQTGG